jgi:hypothetical protein
MRWADRAIIITEVRETIFEFSAPFTDMLGHHHAPLSTGGEF